MVFKNICIIIFWAKVALALDGLRALLVVEAMLDHINNNNNNNDNNNDNNNNNNNNDNNNKNNNNNNNNNNNSHKMITWSYKTFYIEMCDKCQMYLVCGKLASNRYFIVKTVTIIEIRTQTCLY